MQWTRVMKREPLFRNQSELEEVMAVNDNAVQLCIESYHDLPPESMRRNLAIWERIYEWPAIEKVYGVKIRDEEERDALFEWLEMQENKPEELNRGPRWSLNTPEKEADFWEWFEDDKTGKPVLTTDVEQDSAVKKSKSPSRQRTRSKKKKSTGDQGSEKSVEGEN